MTNINGCLTSWNPAAERLFGCPKAAALGKFIWDIVAAKDEIGLAMKPKLESVVKKFNSSTKPILEEFDAQVKDSADKEHWICFSVSPSRIQGEVNNIIFTMKEVSARKEREI